jgi:hypothetical protein
VVFGLGHSLSSLTRPRPGLWPEVGIWAATFAAAGLVASGVVGVDILGAAPGRWRRSYRNHLLGMLSVLVLGTAHVILNGPFGIR